MENLPIDIILLMVMDLDTIEAIRLCRTSRKFNNAICNNHNFWRNRLARDYGFQIESNDPVLLKDYYRLLYQMYNQGKYNLVHQEATEKGYYDLIDVVDNVTVWGLVNTEGNFRVGHLIRMGNNGKYVTRRKCTNYRNPEIIYLILQLTDAYSQEDLMPLTRERLCDILRDILRTQGKLFNDKKLYFADLFTTERPRKVNRIEY